MMFIYSSVYLPGILGQKNTLLCGVYGCADAVGWDFFGDTYPEATESIPRDMHACLTTMMIILY
jgi:hypothetical protein